MDSHLVSTRPPRVLPLTSFTFSPEVAMEFACRSVLNFHFLGFTDPRTHRPFGGGPSSQCVFLLARASPGCSLVPLGPAAIKQSEQEILGASIRFRETYHRTVLNPAIQPLSTGRLVPVQDTTGARPVPNTMFCESAAGQLYAPFEVLFFSGEILPA